MRGIVAGSPAAQAGLQEGDVITAVDGKTASGSALWELQEILKTSGHVVRLDLQRGTKSLTCDLTLRPLA